MRKEKKNLLFSLAALVLTMLISALLMFSLIERRTDLGGYGLLGVFSIALLGHITVIAKDLFVPLFISLTVMYHPLILGFVAGVGGAIGETVTYCWGFSIRKALNRRDIDDRVSSLIRRYGFLAVFVVAASPLPDTPIILLAGSAELPLIKLLAAEILGKVLWYSAGAYLGSSIFTFMSTSLGQLASSLLIFTFSLVLCVVIYSKRLRLKAFSVLQRILNF